MSLSQPNANPLRRWRRANRVTQAQLAEALSVHPSVVCQWERQRSIPSLERFHDLHRHTGIAVHSLLRFFAPLPEVPRTGGVVLQFSHSPKR